MELLLWPYINTAAPQGPTALGKAPERSRGALSLPSANPHEVQWMGPAGGTRFPVLAPTQFPAVQSFPSMGYEHTWTRRCLHGCSWTCTWCCRSFSPCFLGRNGCWRKGAAGFQGCPKPSAVVLGSGCSRDIPAQPQLCHVLLSTVCLGCAGCLHAGQGERAASSLGF